MKPSSMNETDRLIMNQLCKVCGEPAAGYHFGAFTCEGCKSFFGRTYNNLSALGECKNNGECVINKKNRTSCKSCRLKKCLMVGMSKSGSRYGRRSNWFKIHCLIQDQQEMSNRMAEQGVLPHTTVKNGGTPTVVVDDLKISDPKEFLAKYKENELRNNNSGVPNLNELTAAVAINHNNNNNNNINNNNINNNNNSHRISPRLAASPSTTNSESSLGRSISSPFHPGLFDSAKMANPFTNPYLPAAAAAAAAANQASVNAAAFSANEFQKEFNNLANRFNPATIPLAPISPLSPLAVSRFFLQNSAILGKRFNELQKLQNEQMLLNQATRLLNPALHPQVTLKPAASKDLVEEMSNGMREFYGDIPEQDGPIDLSTKRISDFKELSLAAIAEMTKCSKQVPGDHDSGFSPSSNEDNHNTSPLDLTSSTNHNTSNLNNSSNKRPCLLSNRSLAPIANNSIIGHHTGGGGGGGGKSASMMLMKSNKQNSSKMLIDVVERLSKTVEDEQDDEEVEDEDVDVDDDVDDCGADDGDDETSDVEINDIVDDDQNHHRKDFASTTSSNRSKTPPSSTTTSLDHGQSKKRPRESSSTNHNKNNNSHRQEIPCTP